MTQFRFKVFADCLFLYVLNWSNWAVGNRKWWLERRKCMTNVGNWELKHGFLGHNGSWVTCFCLYIIVYSWHSFHHFIFYFWLDFSIFTQFFHLPCVSFISLIISSLTYSYFSFHLVSECKYAIFIQDGVKYIKLSSNYTYVFLFYNSMITCIGK